MCDQQLVDLNEDDSNKKRRRNKAHSFMSFMWNSGHCYTGGGGNSSHVGVGVSTHISGGRPSTYRNLCLLTATLAFVLGLFVGVMIPLYLLPGAVSMTSPQEGIHRISPVLCTNASYSSSNVSSSPFKHNLNASVRSNGNVRHSTSSGTTKDTNGYRLSGSARIMLRTNWLSNDPPLFPSVSFISQSSSSIVLPIETSTLTMPTRASGARTTKEGGGKNTPDPDQWTATNEIGRLIQNGIYWGSKVEDAMPVGFKDSDAESWHRFARKTPVVKVEEGCGRMQNRLLTFEDGTRSCCRYRQNTDQIQGELFSFYLGQILELRNLAPSSLALIRLRDPLWSRVRPQLTLAQWNEERAVVLTRFVPSLEPAHIPVPLRTSARRLHPPDVLSMTGAKDIPELVELAQWSDLIVFDYLTANLDRVVNNLYNLQWNPAMMDAPAHNLAREPISGLLVFFDNESGLLHGYRLLDKYEHYHGALLDSLCVFRNSTAAVLKHLHREKNVGQLLQARFETSEPEFRDYLPSLPDKSVKILNERVDRVFDQISRCELQYAERKVTES